MIRYIAALIIPFFGFAEMLGQNRGIVVADRATHEALARASVFDRNGRLIGICSGDGIIPYISPGDFPVTIRYIGYHEHIMENSRCDTVFLDENIMELPEFIVEARNRNILHILGYVREYSTLSTYTDTIFMFREKMVDFMLPSDSRSKFKGWRTPRVLASKSYYRFTDASGKDSVSNRCNQHFSWSDWIRIPRSMPLTDRLRKSENAADTIYGKYSPTEIWSRKRNLLTIEVNVLADTTSRRWVPNFSNFFQNNLDFEQLRLWYNYDLNDDLETNETDLTIFSMLIESNGRGRNMFMFNRKYEPFFVSTFAEIYIMDKEYITVKDARKIAKKIIKEGDFPIYEPQSVPELSNSVVELINRVNSADYDAARLSASPDKRLAGRKVDKINVGERILKRLKGMFGIDNIAAKRKWKRQWEEFRDDRKSANRKDSIL